MSVQRGARAHGARLNAIGQEENLQEREQQLALRGGGARRQRGRGRSGGRRRRRRQQRLECLADGAHLGDDARLKDVEDAL